MPIYEYRSRSTTPCSNCAQGFDLLQKIREAALTACPACGEPIGRVISAPFLGKTDATLDPQNLAKHGFTQYRKSSKGVYEKTAGKGPKVITDE